MTVRTAAFATRMAMLPMRASFSGTSVMLRLLRGEHMQGMALADLDDVTVVW